MLHDFVIANRSTIISRAQSRVSLRPSPLPTAIELTSGIPVFLDQLIEALRRAESNENVDHHDISASATEHGHHLLRMGLTIGQVVHDYGDVCQTITGLALELNAPIPSDQFSTLNLCLDDAIAGAVTEYSRQREVDIAASGTERLGIFAHELRNLLNVAVLSYDRIRIGKVAAGGSTGQVLHRSLMGLQTLIDRSLSAVRLDAGIELREKISVAGFVDEVEISATIQAEAKGVPFIALPAEANVFIEGDRQILGAALANLLQNAFKFTRASGTVTLTTLVTETRVMFEVQDGCGGLPAGVAEDLFRPFEQRSDDRSGLGLGLSICLRAARANHGELKVRDLPGQGCVFTLDLPRLKTPAVVA